MTNSPFSLIKPTLGRWKESVLSWDSSYFFQSLFLITGIIPSLQSPSESYNDIFWAKVSSMVFICLLELIALSHFFIHNPKSFLVGVSGQVRAALNICFARWKFFFENVLMASFRVSS